MVNSVKCIYELNDIFSNWAAYQTHTAAWTFSGTGCWSQDVGFLPHLGSSSKYSVHKIRHTGRCSICSDVYASAWMTCCLYHHRNTPDNVALFSGITCHFLLTKICLLIGQEDYDRLRPLSYQEVNLVIICYDVTNPTSFENVTIKVKSAGNETVYWWKSVLTLFAGNCELINFDLECRWLYRWTTTENKQYFWNLPVMSAERNVPSPV